MTDLGELPERTEAGTCVDCHGWTRDGRVIAEIDSNSGAGATIVRCAACAKGPRPVLQCPRRPDPTEPRRYPG